MLCAGAGEVAAGTDRISLNTLQLIFWAGPSASGFAFLHCGALKLCALFAI